MAYKRKWEDIDPADNAAHYIPFFESLGFEVEFAYEDKRYNRTTPSNPPMGGLIFKKGIVNVWSLIEGRWVATCLIDGCYKYHAYYRDINNIKTYKHYK